MVDGEGVADVEDAAGCRPLDCQVFPDQVAVPCFAPLLGEGKSGSSTSFNEHKGRTLRFGSYVRADRPPQPAPSKGARNGWMSEWQCRFIEVLIKTLGLVPAMPADSPPP